MAIVVDTDLEEGTLADLDTIVPAESSDIQVSADAALGGSTYGLKVIIDDTSSRYGQNTFSAPSTDLRARIYIDINSLTMAAATYFTFVSINTTSSILAQFVLTNNGVDYRIRFRTLEDDGTPTSTYIVVTDAEHYVEMHLERGAGTGRHRMWIDGTLQATHSSLDNDAKFDALARVRQGAQYVASGVSGEFYLDELIVRDEDTTIGPNSTTTGSTTGGTTTTGAATTTATGSGSTSTYTDSGTGTMTTAAPTTTATTTTEAPTTTNPPVTIRLRDGPEEHAARAAAGDRGKIEFLGDSGVEVVWVQVISVTDPGGGEDYYEYSVRRVSGDSVTVPEGATVVFYGPSGSGIIRIVGED